MQAGGFAGTNPSFMESSPQMVARGGFGSPTIVTEARAAHVLKPFKLSDLDAALAIGERGTDPRT